MILLQAALLFATTFANSTGGPNSYNHQIMEEAVAGMVAATSDPQEIETLIRISRFESGGWRKDVATCKVKGDGGAAHGLYQIHPYNSQEKADACSPDLSRQASAALFHIRESISACRRYGLSGGDLLGIYTTGHCFAHNRFGRLRYGDGSTISRLLHTEDNQAIAKHTQSPPSRYKSQKNRTPNEREINDTPSPCIVSRRLPFNFGLRILPIAAST